MARRLRSLADREALLAVGLASLGFVSLAATLPAAGVLGVRAIRMDRGGDGSGPAIGMLVLPIAWLTIMWTLPIARAVTTTAVGADDLWRLVGFVAGWLALAAAILVLATFLVRCHPERWTARRAARAGIVAAVTAGLLQLQTTVGEVQYVGGPCGPTNADCLGAIPWAAGGLALAVGCLWFAISSAVSRFRR
jgi:hypothetical protein